MLTIKDKSELRSMTTEQLHIVARRFSLMAAHPLQVTDQPGRLAAIAAEAKAIISER